MKSANDRINELEKRLESETGTTTANSDYISELEAQVKKLQKYKDEQDAFEKRSKSSIKRLCLMIMHRISANIENIMKKSNLQMQKKIYKQCIK